MDRAGLGTFLMNHRASLVGSLTLAGVAAALASGVGNAQVPRPDSSRTVIIDSVQKTYGVGTLAPRQALAADLARTVDAEVRVAMFEMASGDELPALSRLERVAAIAARDSSGSAAPERAALHFLLAQSYYRMGMLAPFRQEAEAALSTGATRYATVLRPQLVVEAYRSGDYARATTLARDLPAGELSAIGTLAAGLAAYQSGDLPAARAAFQRAASAQGQLAAYAKYMDAVAQLRADTTQAAGVVTTLESIAASTSGTPFGEQVRLTAAQVAYEGGRHADAVRIASTVSESSPLAAPALLTRAWALYKLDRVDEAERAFTDFVTRYPNRPERREAQLMTAQAQLELGRSADAERVFQSVADSAAAEARTFQAQTNAAIATLARALVTERAGELLGLADPVGAKALILRDSAGAADALALVAGTPNAAPSLTASSAVDAASASQRLDSIGARTSPSVTRVLFAPASATTRPRELAERSQSLVGADAAVLVARYRLTEQLEAQEREMALLARLGTMLAADSAVITNLAAAHQSIADSLARVDQLMAGAAARIRQTIGVEVQATRALATENARTADSLRTALAPIADADGRAAIDAEIATAAAYSRIAEMLAGGLDAAITRHPAFVLRDSVRAHDARTRAILADLQGSYSRSRADIAGALTALRGGDAPATRAARQALSDAEARRTTIEGEVIAAVTAELTARANEMVASLQRNTEAAQFGTASAAFFRAIDSTRAVGGTGAGGAARNAVPERRR
jgi:tetratricopeptide (TPR) repeat protein